MRRPEDAHPATFRYRLVRTSWGWMAIVARNRWLAAVALPLKSPAAARTLVRRRWPGALPNDALMPTLARQVRDYFAGRRARFTPRLNLRGLSLFQAAALAACRRIPAGQTASYGELAARAGKPGAARAVGRAMAGNPFPLVVPCHRVVASDGTLAGFSARGGLRLKARLLEHERRHFRVARGQNARHAH